MPAVNPRVWGWFALVLSVAAGLLFVDLGSSEFRTWDEALYGRLARNAIEHSTYLYAVDDDGSYFRRFSKPPMTLWLTVASFKTFGMSVTALRIPFALGMLGTVAAAFAWGRRIGGVPMAVAWGLGLALSAAALRWGRHACIEPLFLASMMTALWAYHGSVVTDGAARHRWAIACGVAFALAFMTKQVAVGLGVFPILMFEAWRRDKAALVPLAWALGIPLLVGALWFGLASEATDGAVFEGLLDRGVRKRMAGFSSGQNARTLNELTGVLTEATVPLPWPLGAAGLALLAAQSLRRRTPEDRVPPALLLPLTFVAAVVVLENVSSSMLPWYGFHLVVPVVGGAAWCVGATAQHPERGPQDDGWAWTRWALGWASLATMALIAVGSFASQLNAALVAAGVLLAALRFGTGTVRVVAIVGAALAVLGGRLRDPELHAPDSAFTSLMPKLAAHENVAVDKNTGLPGLAADALFGPTQVSVRRAPWPTQKHPAYVSTDVVPAEFEPPPGVRLERTAGATTFIGDLDQPVWDNATLAQLLEEGPVTFEAEHLGATGWWSTYDDAEASGGQLRRLSQFRNEQPARRGLSIGPKLWLPRGRYQIEFWVGWRCPDEHGEHTAAALAVKGQLGRLVSENLACKDGSGAIEPQRFDFRLPDAQEVLIRVGYRGGAVEHDKTVLRKLD